MEETVKKDFRYYFIFFVHVVFISSWLTSPFWLPWPLLIALSLLLALQTKYLGYCVVTKWQFGSKDARNRSFWVYYLNKIGIKVRKEQITEWTKIFLIASPIIAFLWQQIR